MIKKILLILILVFAFSMASVAAEDMYFNVTFGPTNTTALSLHANNGDLTIAGNLSLKDKITFRLGATIDNLASGWINVSGGLKTTGSILANGDINATGRICDSSGMCIEDLAHYGKDTVGPYLYNDSSNIYFNDTLLNQTIVSQVGIQLGLYNALNATSGNYVYDVGGVVYFNATKLNQTILQLSSSSGGKGADGNYLYNDSTTIYFNASKLNETIMALDTNTSKLQIEMWGFLNSTDGDFLYTQNNGAFFNGTKLNETIQALDYCSGGQCGSLVINGNLTVIGSFVNMTVYNVVSNGTFKPQINGTFDLGTATEQWRNIYADTINAKIDWSNIQNINSNDIFNIVNNGTFLYTWDQRYNDTAYINSEIAGMNNLSLATIVANIGNWSADKPNYITNHSSINMTNIYVEDFIAVRKVHGNDGQSSYIYFPGNSMVMHFE